MPLWWVYADYTLIFEFHYIVQKRPWICCNRRTISIPLNELVDFTAELARLDKELAAAKQDEEFINKKLSNKGFVDKAPAAVVEQQRENLKKVMDKIALLQSSIADIKSKM